MSFQLQSSKGEASNFICVGVWHEGDPDKRNLTNLGEESILGIAAQH